MGEARHVTALAGVAVILVILAKYRRAQWREEKIREFYDAQTFKIPGVPLGLPGMRIFFNTMLPLAAKKKIVCHSSVS